MKLSAIFLNILNNQRDYEIKVIDEEHGLYEYGYKRETNYRSLHDIDVSFHISNNKSDNGFIIQETIPSGANTSFLIQSSKNLLCDFFIKAILESDDIKDTVNSLKNIQFVYSKTKVTPYKNWKKLLEVAELNTTYLDYNQFCGKSNSSKALKEFYFNSGSNNDLTSKSVKDLLNFFITKYEPDPIFDIFKNNIEKVSPEIYELIENILKNTEYFEHFSQLVNKKNEIYNTLFEDKKVNIITFSLSYPYLLKKYPISVIEPSKTATASDYETLISQMIILMKENKKDLNFKRLHVTNRVTTDKDFLFQIEENNENNKSFKKEFFIKLFEQYLEVFVNEISNQLKENTMQRSIYAAKEFISKNAREKLKNYVQLVSEYENEPQKNQTARKNNKI